MPPPMQAYYADHFVLPLPAGHSFPMGKHERPRKCRVAACPGIALAAALPVSDGELALAHASTPSNHPPLLSA